MDQPSSTTISEDEQIELFFRHGYLAESNDAMAKMYGFSSADEIIGTRLPELLVPTEPQNIEYLRAFIRSGHRLLDAESVEVGKDGIKHYFLNNLVAVVKDGLLYRSWGTQRDISELKRVQQQIQESEELYRQMALNAGDVLYVITPGSERVDWYGQIDGMLGYDEGEWPRTIASWIRNVHPDDIVRVAMAFHHACLNVEPLSEEYRICRADGSYVYWNDRAKWIRGEDGTVLRFVGACTTSPSANSASARRYSRPRGSCRGAGNRAKGSSFNRSATNSGPDGRSYAGMTELALIRTSLQNGATLDMVKLSADSLLNVINDILDFSKSSRVGQIDQSPSSQATS
jgi:PAS domain S-box-containing protein